MIFPELNNNNNSNNLIFIIKDSMIGEMPACFVLGFLG